MFSAENKIYIIKNRLLTKDPLSSERVNGQAKEKKNFAEEGREEMF